MRVVGLAGLEVTDVPRDGGPEEVGLSLEDEKRNVEIGTEPRGLRRRDRWERVLRERGAGAEAAVKEESVVDPREGLHCVDVCHETARGLRLAGTEHAPHTEWAHQARRVRAANGRGGLG